jgi:DNA-binding beta-propeller fold protein YncE
LPALAVLTSQALAGDVTGAKPPAGPLVPVALAWGSGARLYVALREARRVVGFEAKTWRRVSDWEVGVRPSDLALADDRSTLLVGAERGRFRAIDSSGRIISQLTLGRGPSRVASLGAGRAAVACLWDNAVHVVDWRRGRVEATHRLPFSPRAMVVRPDGRLIVADAFGGGLVDLVPGVPGRERYRSLDGVNLHALATSGDGKELLLAHMAQYDAVPVTEANIDRGLVLSSRLSAVRLSDFDLDGRPGEPLPRRGLTLDGSRHGAADPSALAVGPDGSTVLIALAGAHQVLLNRRTEGTSTVGADDLLPLGHNQRLGVVEVGRTPVGLAIDPTGTLAVTADAMSDTLSVVKVADLSPVITVQLADGAPARTAAQRGEALFHDGRRALDRWMSCASCHSAGHTNGLNFDTLGDGGFGAPKNTPSLLGVGPTAPFAWTGRFPKLADQVHQSLVSSLRGPRPDAGVLEDLTSYLESLEPPPPLRDRNDPAALRGAEAFRARRCDSCHHAPFWTTTALRDVGLDDGPGGHRSFNPPSLRGVARSAPYFHDGRSRSLDEALRIHHPGQADPPPADERADLIAFLESL